MEAFDIDLRDRLADVYRGGRWICVMTFADSATRFMGQVAGAAGFETPADGDDSDPPLIGLAVHGTESDPDDGFPVLSLDLPSSGDFVTDALATASGLAELPESITARLDEWDPDREARALVPSLMTDQPLAGRQTFGARPAEWAALEDKLAVLDLWAEASIPTAPAAVVALDDRRDLDAAQRRLSGSNGTVWAVDNARGMHGGAAGTHWVPTRAAAADLAERLAGDHARVRVMPFLTGIPCSIHGIVLDDATVTSRPNEMMVYVEPSAHRIHYCRFANHWDPSPADRQAMTATAVAVGEVLRSAVDFRGVFSLDGVLTVDGFRPTEINPRYGMALPFNLPAGDDGPAVNMVLLDKAIIAGALRLDAERFQTWLHESLDRNRRGGASFATVNRSSETRTAAVVDCDGQMILTDIESDRAEEANGRAAMATVDWQAIGAEHRLNIAFGDRFPTGPPAAPLAWRIARMVDGQWDIGLTELVPALSLR